MTKVFMCGGERLGPATTNDKQYFLRAAWRRLENGYGNGAIFRPRHPEPCEGSKRMQARHRSWVYVLASRKNGTLYVGVTTELRRRIWQHKAGEIDGFTRRYGVRTLVRYEEFRALRDAISREKEIKGWTRRRKVELIESANPDWDDLAASWFERGLDPSLGSG